MRFWDSRHSHPACCGPGSIGSGTLTRVTPRATPTSGPLHADRHPCMLASHTDHDLQKLPGVGCFLAILYCGLPTFTHASLSKTQAPSTQAVSLPLLSLNFPTSCLDIHNDACKTSAEVCQMFSAFFLFQRCSMPLAPARVPLPFCTPHSHALFFFLLLCVLALWSHPLTATPIPTAWEKESLVWKVYVHEFRPSDEILLFVSRSRLAIPSHFSTAPNLARLFFLWH